MGWLFNRKKADEDREFRVLSSQNIFTHDVYHGTTDIRYRLTVNQLETREIVPLVQERARKDGQWCIDMDLVGNNQAKMLEMILYCCDELRIIEKVHFITRHDDPSKYDIDFICRDIANGSR